MRKVIELEEPVRIGDIFLEKGQKIRVKEASYSSSAIQSNINKVISNYKKKLESAKKKGDSDTVKLYASDIKDLEYIYNLFNSYSGFKKLFNKIDSLDTVVRDDLADSGLFELRDLYEEVLDLAQSYGVDIINYIKNINVSSLEYSTGVNDLLNMKKALEKMYSLLF